MFSLIITIIKVFLMFLETHVYERSASNTTVHYVVQLLIYFFHIKVYEL